MRTIVSILLVLALGAAMACAPKVNDPADVQAVKQTLEAYAKAVNAGDAEGALAMMTEQTIYADNHIAVAVGKAAVKPIIDAQITMFKTDLQVPVDEVRVTGDTAVARGTWTVVLTPKAEGPAPIRDGGSWMITLSRQADRTWKWDAVVPNSNQPMPGTTADGAAEQALMQIEREWADAMMKGDIPAVEKYLGKEWTFTNDGQVTPRAQFLAELKSGTYKFQSLAMRDVSVHVFGDVAVATMIADLKGTYKGTDISSSSRGTDFFVKRDGRWQGVSSQNVTIKQ